ncbi:MAG: SpoVR family protein [Deltaproteobacteria bacterium]|jgi:stage V sporulation protein R|nr:SpoVR family protein [Deltaproteobacteria bacterium]
MKKQSSNKSRSSKYQTHLPADLEKVRKRIEGYAKDFGLDFFDVIYEVLDWNQINEVASYGGFPNRYPHWRFGMEYEQLAKSYSYGLSKIYEMVINNDPCFAYLLYSNSMVDQKLVMAHVYAHCDFFKNNLYFAHTNRKMMDEMANHKTRIMRYIDEHGQDKVESFIDSCLAIENLIDYHAPAIKRTRAPGGDIGARRPVRKLRADRQYMDKYINPSKFMDEQQEQIDKEVQMEKQFPEHPQKDVLLFLLEYSPLDNWERDILSIIREEAYYFAPQGQTKIMNEGWASYWHSKIMTQKVLTDAEIIDYADHHSGTVAMGPTRINPYKIGLELMRDIEERWNTGRFGKEYDECDNMVEKAHWDKKLGLGREKIFEIRRLYNDIMFIDEFLTPEFCAKHNLFIYAYNVSSEQYEVASREFEKIKKQFLFQLTNFGQPIINVVDGNFRNRGELLIKHTHEGVDLKYSYACETLKMLYQIWRRPVTIETMYDGVPKYIHCEGEEVKEERV